MNCRAQMLNTHYAMLISSLSSVWRQKQDLLEFVYLAIYCMNSGLACTRAVTNEPCEAI